MIECGSSCSASAALCMFIVCLRVWEIFLSWGDDWVLKYFGCVMSVWKKESNSKFC